MLQSLKNSGKVAQLSKMFGGQLKTRQTGMAQVNRENRQVEIKQKVSQPGMEHSLKHARLLGFPLKKKGPLLTLNNSWTF